MTIRKFITFPWRFFTMLMKGFNIYKTCLLNFKFLPFEQACKLPIHVYGKLHLSSATGELRINASAIKSGMIVFGANTASFEASQGTSLLSVGGIIQFEGHTLFGRKCTVTVQPLGTILLGHGVRISNSVKIRAYKHIEIKPFVSITSESQVFDTNFHYMRNIVTGEVFPLSKPVVIGRCCWIGNRTSIMKGTILPDHTIVSSNSLLTKDYSDVPSYSIIGGTPAKLLKKNVVRVYEWELYGKLDRHFASSDEPYQAYVGVVDEELYIEKAYFS